MAAAGGSAGGGASGGGRRPGRRSGRSGVSLGRAVVFAPLAALGLLAALFLGFGLRHDPHIYPAALVGRPLPRVGLPGLAGGPAEPLPAVVAEAGRRGPTLLNVFASWCAPCAEEAPALLALRAQGVRLVGMAYKDDPAATRAFLARHGDPFTRVLVDRSGRAGVELGVSGAPETFLVGADGVIRAKHSGPLTPADAEALLEQAR